MVAINLLTVNVCAHRKYSLPTTAAVLVAFTAVLTGLTQGMWADLGFDCGNAMFSLIGIAYLIPLGFLYHERIWHTMSILFSAWIYTLLVFCLSVHLAQLFTGEITIAGILTIQTVLYMASLYAFIRWVGAVFPFAIKNMTPHNRTFLRVVSLCWFISILIIQTAMLYNHARLIMDTEALIKAGKPFRLIFIDLDRFKSVGAFTRQPLIFVRLSDTVLRMQYGVERLSCGRNHAGQAHTSGGPEDVPG